LKFASDPQKFHDLADKISKLSAAQQNSQATTNAPAPVAASNTPQAAPGTPLWMWGLLIGSGVLVLLYFLNRPKPVPVSPYPVQQGVNPLSGAQGFGSQYSPNGPAAYSGAPMALSGSSPIAGAVVGGLAGVAAGYAFLSDRREQIWQAYFGPRYSTRYQHVAGHQMRLGVV